jgi:hypothetical protein
MALAATQTNDVKTNSPSWIVSIGPSQLLYPYRPGFNSSENVELEFQLELFQTTHFSTESWHHTWWDVCLIYSGDMLSAKTLADNREIGCTTGRPEEGTSRKAYRR